MSTSNPVYPFDPTGTAATNRIVGEIQVLSPPNYSDFYFFVPRYAPFFEEGLQLVHNATGRLLVLGEDYIPSHRFMEASKACGKPIYGSITIYKKSIAGACRIDYQTIGGEWTQSEAAILELLNQAITEPRITSWEQVMNPPTRFPVIDHEWDIGTDMVGAKELEAALISINDAMRESSDAQLPQHLADTNNPHGTTKAQVGLGLVENLPLATPAEAAGGTANDRYMTPLRVAQAITAFVGSRIDAHVDNQSNPHGTTKQHVGLGSVQDYGIATLPESEAGSSNVKYMTPATVKAAVQYQVGVTLNSHLAHTGNPHQTTKAQVGLPLVENFAIADALTARAGISNTHYMTPAMVREAILSMSTAGLEDHLNDHSNPHGTTKAQVGLGSVQDFGLASTVEAQAGTVNNKYMTPALVKAAIEALGGGAFNTHINDAGNPHQTDKTQIGLGNVSNYGLATTVEAEQGLSNVKYMTPALVKAAILALGDTTGQLALLNGHIENTENPHGTTKAHVGLSLVQNYGVASQADAEAGTALDRYMTPIRVREAVRAMIDISAVTTHLASQANPHNTTAAQVGAYSKAEADALLVAKLGATQKAADSSKLDGLTLAEILASSVVSYTHPADSTNALSFTRLVAYNVGLSAVQDSKPAASFRVVGGGAAAAVNEPIFEVMLPAADNGTIHITQVAGDPVNVRFAYRNASAGLERVREMYLVGTAGRRAFRVMPSATIPGADYSIVANPTDLNGIAGTPDVHYVALTATRTEAPGDLPFGITSAQYRQTESGALVVQMNVLETGDVASSVSTLASNWEDAYYDWQPHTFGNTTLASKISGNAVWGWDTVADKARATPGNAVPTAVLDRNYYTDYSFEVELSGPAATGHAAGVCIAEITRSGKSIGLYAARTPGQAVRDTQGRYGLFTVGINLGQEDATVLVAKSGDGLQWGDGIFADDRDFDASPLGAASWADAGAVRIRVTRVGNSITIETTNHGTTSYVAAAMITLDLTSDLRLDPFTGSARLGLAQFTGGGTTNFNVLKRPGGFQPYLSTHVDGYRVINEHNGSAWVATQAAVALNFRPGRLVHSMWNGRLYKWRRDGSVKKLHIEADTAQTFTVFTE